MELGGWELLGVWGLVIGILPGVFVFLIRIRGIGSYLELRLEALVTKDQRRVNEGQTHELTN